jgi:NitT/TauT family transport system ATP-binding protein
VDKETDPPPFYPSAKTIVFVTRNVDEAMIAGKVVVIGMNPGRVKEVRSTELPRSGLRQELFGNERSRALRNHLVELLQEDVVNELSSRQVSYPPGDHI